jgi:FtsH-binding integral membrane protein
MNEIYLAAVIIALAAAMIVSLMWVARDARKRKKGFAVVLLCLFTFPIGILIWLLLRPSVPAEDLPT